MSRIMLIVAALALTACSRLPNPPPGADAVQLGPLCQVLSVEEARVKPLGTRDYRVASREFTALCRAANPAAAAIGRAEPLRVRGIMSWNEYQTMGGDAAPYAWTQSGVDWIEDPGIPRPPPGAYSDGPQCNLLVKRFADEVVPCVQQADAIQGQALARLIERQKIESRLFGNTANPNAAIVALDERCIEQWLLINRQLDSTPTIKACRFYTAPDQLSAAREAQAAKAQTRASAQTRAPASSQR